MHSHRTIGLQGYGHGFRGILLNLEPRPSQRTTETGQSLAEFAIVFPVFMLLLGAVLQFGIILWSLNSLNQVARDTGRWAATQIDCTAGVGGAAIIAKSNEVAAQSSLLGYATGSWTSSNVTVSWTGTPCPPTNNSQTAWVRITIRHAVPVFFPWIPANGNISSTTEYRMEPRP